MPYIYVILKSGTQIPVPDAETAGWEIERESRNMIGGPSNGAATRLVCRNGENIIARFNEEDVAGYIWHDGKLA